MEKNGLEDEQTRDSDVRDRLILALYAELKAERQTRETLEEAIRHGVLSKEVLVAIASDPVPAVTSEDIADIERLTDLDGDRLPGRRRQYP